MNQRQGPLDGIRILDAASLLAAPTAASLLAEFGAEVVKIEQPTVGDTMRRYPPFRDDLSLLWKVIGKNRESITLNLREPEGREIFKQLLPEFDVVTLNYRPETLVKWGLDFEDLVKVRSDIVVMHLTAFGRTGPYAQRPGFARVAEAFSGLAHRSGFPDREPVLSGYPMLGDGVAGLYGAFSALLALRERDLTGEAQLIDIGLYEPLLRLIEDQIPAYMEDGTTMDRTGNSNPLISPNGLFPTRDSKYVAIPASTDQIWSRLVDLIGDQSLLEYDSNPKRIENRERVESAVRTWTLSHDLKELVELCAEAGIACGPVYSAADIVDDPHINERQSIVEVQDAESGRPIRMASSAGRFSGFTARRPVPGPGLGAHTASVLESLLGFDAERIEELRTKDII